jgi:hypothetical protein
MHRITLAGIIPNRPGRCTRGMSLDRYGDFTATYLPTYSVREKPMDLRSKLIADAERYCASAGISKARLATIVAKDGKFFVRLEKGGDCTLGMYERFQAFFAEHAAPAPGEAA